MEWAFPLNAQMCVFVCAHVSKLPLLYANIYSPNVNSLKLTVNFPLLDIFPFQPLFLHCTGHAQYEPQLQFFLITHCFLWVQLLWIGLWAITNSIMWTMIWDQWNLDMQLIGVSTYQPRGWQRCFLVSITFPKTLVFKSYRTTKNNNTERATLKRKNGTLRSFIWRR